MEDKTEMLSNDCVHCGRCTNNCEFLHKYKLDLAGFEARSDLAYSCYMCSDCKRVCPLNIDGHQIALQLRRATVKQHTKKSIEKEYRSLIIEKKDYIFKNYSNLSSAKAKGKITNKKTVFFPGCNMVAFIPNTMKMLMQVLHEKANIETVFDCCGKPIYELGLMAESEQISKRIKQRLHDNGVTELVTACPNCYYFLKPLLDIPVNAIYDKMRELEIGQVLDLEKYYVYKPCPDRDSQEFLRTITPYLRGEIVTISNVQCCGLGGSAAVREPDLSIKFIEKLKKNSAPAILTYCASCAGHIQRSGYQNIEHVLPLILGIDEQVPKGLGSLLNRARHKFF